MTQILVTIEDISMAKQMMSAIEKMKGVIHTSLCQGAETARPGARQHSERIMRMRGMAREAQKEAQNDERLSYLLRK